MLAWNGKPLDYGGFMNWTPPPPPEPIWTSALVSSYSQLQSMYANLPDLYVNMNCAVTYLDQTNIHTTVSSYKNCITSGDWYIYNGEYTPNPIGWMYPISIDFSIENSAVIPEEEQQYIPFVFGPAGGLTRTLYKNDFAEISNISWNFSAIPTDCAYLGQQITGVSSMYITLTQPDRAGGYAGVYFSNVWCDVSAFEDIKYDIVFTDHPELYTENVIVKIDERKHPQL